MWVQTIAILTLTKWSTPIGYDGSLSGWMDVACSPHINLLQDYMGTFFLLSDHLPVQLPLLSA